MLTGGGDDPEHHVRGKFTHTLEGNEGIGKVRDVESGRQGKAHAAKRV